MIKERRNEQKRGSKRGPKKTAAVDKAVGAGRAKREAAIKARRGLAESKKPSAMEVEREVYRQSRQRASTKAKNEKKATNGRIAPDSTGRRARKKKEEETKAVFGVQPSKKAVAAAVSAMKKEGFKIPEGMQVVITVAPLAVTKGKGPNAPTNNNKGRKPNNSNAKNNTKSKPRGGGGRKN